MLNNASGMDWLNIGIMGFLSATSAISHNIYTLSFLYFVYWINSDY